MEHDDRSEQVVNFLTGLALGAVIGAGVALLTAPRSGRGTRRRLQRTASSVRSNTSDRFEELADDLKGRVDDAVDGARKRLRR